MEEVDRLAYPDAAVVGCEGWVSSCEHKIVVQVSLSFKKEPVGHFKSRRRTRRRKSGASDSGVCSGHRPDQQNQVARRHRIANATLLVDEPTSFAHCLCTLEGSWET